MNGVNFVKVLTIKEPWASLIINGYKKYEFRSWKTNYRGKILIHAGLSTDNFIMDNISKYNIKLNNGYIVGEIEIVDCILVDNEFDSYLRNIDNTIYGNNHIGLYAWKLDNIKIYENPIMTKGKLGLWNYTGINN